MKDYTFTNPAYGLDHTEVASDLSKQRPDYEHFDYPGRYKQDASGAPFIKARLEALRSNACTASGKSNRPDFTAGGRFGLEGHFDDAVNADWLLTSVVHRGVQPQALEEEAGPAPTTHGWAPNSPRDRTWGRRNLLRSLWPGEGAFPLGPL